MGLSPHYLALLYHTFSLFTGYQRFETAKCFVSLKRDMLYYVRCIHIVSICNAKTITVSISGWRLWYILCLNCERIFLRIQGQCFTVLTRLSVQVIVGLKKIHIRPNRPKNEASELNVVLQLHYQVKKYTYTYWFKSM